MLSHGLVLSGGCIRTDLPLPDLGRTQRMMAPPDRFNVILVCFVTRTDAQFVTMDINGDAWKAKSHHNRPWDESNR